MHDNHDDDDDDVDVDDDIGIGKYPTAVRFSARQTMSKQTLTGLRRHAHWASMSVDLFVIDCACTSSFC